MKPFILASTAFTSGITSLPSTSMGQSGSCTGAVCGAPFGHVDLVAVEHGVDGAAQIGLASQVLQLEGFFGDQVLRVIDQDVATEGEGELCQNAWGSCANRS